MSGAGKGMHLPRMRTPDHGFTLFEVAISLALVALGVTSVLMLFPLGIRTQQLARFQLLAVAKAQEMVECFAAGSNLNPAIDTEAGAAWDVAVGHRSLSNDLEIRLATHNYGIAPVPLDIARRLDSDGDEIATILASGGYLYYSQPMATTSFFQSSLGAFQPSETQRLVFAVDGYAQANAMHSFPWKAWPYYIPYPSPPIHGTHRDEFLPTGAIRYVARGYTESDAPSYCYETCNDPADPTFSEMAKVFDHVEAGATYGYKPYAYDPGAFPGNAADCSPDGAMRYFQAALWYAARIGTLNGWSTDFHDPADATQFRRAFIDEANAYREVHAMRFLAHAATCLTRWWMHAELQSPGLPIPPVTISGITSPAMAMTHGKIVYFHESAMNLVMRYASSFPYDFGAPRPHQRATMMDHPLIEWDLFAQPASGTLFGSAIAAQQWQPLPASPITHIGRSYQLPDRDIPAAIFSDGLGSASPSGGRFSLTAPFQPAERCRQLLFWAVDWQAYEDAETAPGAPLDASKYPIAGPVHENGNPTTVERRMDWFDFASSQLYAFRNPEKVMSFIDDVSWRPTGDDIGALRHGEDFATSRDRGVTPSAVRIMSALHGADRNFNGRLDRGPLAKATRLRAQSVGRFNFYDPRLTLVIR
ncbi:MAG: hypothetical protein H0X45_00155 [Planctomycetes bacterium]|nr:hypothetical protein [Planctomycetota bacterium]